MNFVDLHSHVLFGLDDGAADEPTSVALVRGLASVGFTHICATPHQKQGQYFPSLADIRARFATLTNQPPAPEVAFTLGAENMWDDVFFERWQAGTLPSYGDGPAFLFELNPSLVPAGLTDHLFKFAMSGKLPVMAHPERYAGLQRDDGLVQRVRGVCAMVVDLGAVAGAHGRAEAKTARRWIEDDIAHAAASDAHTMADVKLAAEGIAWIRKRKGDAAVQKLLADAPRAILQGELP